MGEIPAVLLSLDPTVVAVLEPELSWAWLCCDACSEFRYTKRTRALVKCSMTPRCGGHLRPYLAMDCDICGKAVTTRRRQSDTRFCSNKCQKEAS